MPIQPPPSNTGVLFKRAKELLAYVNGLFQPPMRPFSRVMIMEGGGDPEIILEEYQLDEETLAVCFAGIRTGLPGIPQMTEIQWGTVLTADLDVFAIRLRPDVEALGQMPQNAEQLTTAEQVWWDRWTLYTAFVEGVQQRTVWSDPDTKAQIVEYRPWGPHGGLVGSVLRIGVSLV